MESGQTKGAEPRLLIDQRVSCASSMDVAAGYALGPDEAVLVVSGTEREARGSRGRRWTAPEGGLWFSMGLGWRPDLSANGGVDATGLVAALAMAVALEVETGLDVRIKWPNDLLVSGKKVGGVLVEGGVGEGARVVGIGVNVNLTADAVVGSLGEAPRFAVTTVLDETGYETDLSALLEAFRIRFMASIREVDREGLPGLLLNQIHRRLAWRAGGPDAAEIVLMKRSGAEIGFGEIEGLDRHGRLIVRKNGEDGGRVACVAGEIAVRADG